MKARLGIVERDSVGLKIGVEGHHAILKYSFGLSSLPDYFAADIARSGKRSL